jgi:hypothetical protein
MPSTMPTLSNPLGAARRSISFAFPPSDKRKLFLSPDHKCDSRRNDMIKLCRQTPDNRRHLPADADTSCHKPP